MRPEVAGEPSKAAGSHESCVRGLASILGAVGIH